MTRFLRRWRLKYATWLARNTADTVSSLEAEIEAHHIAGRGGVDGRVTLHVVVDLERATSAADRARARFCRLLTDKQLRAERGVLLVAKGDLLGGVIRSDRASLKLTSGEERLQRRLSADLLAVDRELCRRGAAPWNVEGL